jgi:D-threo-aldose 1-dehydrogenase
VGRIETVTIGTSSLGAGTEPGSAEDESAISVATAMLTGPFARIDTSNAYAGGRSEAVLGAALRRLATGDPAAVITKVDADPLTGKLDRDRALRSFEESLGRLGVDRVGLLHLHDPHTITLGEAESPDGVIAGLLELRSQGLVDAIGIAAGPVPLVRDYLRTEAFDAVLTHNRFTLVDRTAETLISEAKGHGMSVFNAAPFGSGILAGGTQRESKYAYRPASADVIARVKQLESLCRLHDVPLAAVALHFSIRSPLVDSTVVGVRSLKRLKELELLAATTVPAELWDELDALGAPPDPLASELEGGSR